jgi:glycosyltransferase involved in cell wall biosynthesis
VADPLVSVVVPAWNAERTLKETLESVAAQTYRNLEILVVDDGSTDGTADIAADFCAGEPRARLIRTINGGVAAARNHAIVGAAGEWIAPLDADDLWHPTKVEKQVAAALAAPEPPGFIYCWHRFIDEESRVTGSGPRWALSGRAFNQLAYLNVVENGSALMLLREAVLEVGGYDESLRAREAQGCEDVMLQLQVARRYPVAVVPEHLVGHRRHSRNMSGDFDRMVRSWRLVYRQVKAEGPGIPRRVLRWVNAKCALDIAERRAAAGNYLGAAGQLAGALVRDPVRSGSIFVYRVARSAVRRVSRRRTTAAAHFIDVDPCPHISGDPHELRSLSRLLDRLNARRLRRLAAIERTYS